MPSPDVTAYVDLTITDKDAQDVFDTAIEQLKITMPEWKPREGNTEVLLLEALALEAADVIYSINRLPGAIVEVLLKLYGIERDVGTPPQVLLEFQVASTSEANTIPAGTSVQVELDGGNDPIVFTTNTELEISAGQSTGQVTATGDRFTSEGNGIPIGTVGQILDSILYVDVVVLASAIEGGVSPELDDDYFVRGTQRFRRLSDTLVLPSHFTSFALEQPYVLRATTLDAYNPANDSNENGPVGVDGGHVTIAVYGDNVVLTTGQKADLLAKIDPLVLSTLAVHVIDPNIVTQAVDVTVVPTPGYDVATVLENVTNALEAYFDPMKWNWSTVIRRNEVISLISTVEGVDFVQALTVPAADVNITLVAPLINLGTVNVTVDVG